MLRRLLISDHLGSVRLVVNSNSGAVAQRLDYDEYGNVLADTNPGFQPFAYGGGLYDVDTGLVRFGARDYDASVGRWLQSDPIGLAGEFNVYGYALQNPIMYADYNGLAPDWVGSTGAVLGATGGAIFATGLYTGNPYVMAGGAAVSVTGLVLTGWDMLTTPVEQLDKIKSSDDFILLKDSFEDLNDTLESLDEETKYEEQCE